jgi:hypothetical protein
MCDIEIRIASRRARHLVTASRGGRRPRLGGAAEAFRAPLGPTQRTIERRFYSRGGGETATARSAIGPAHQLSTLKPCSFSGFETR